MTKLHPNEGDVKQEVRKLLAKHKWDYWMPPANMFGKSGQADTLAVRPGVFMAIETKGPKNKKPPTKNQLDFLTMIARNGHIALVVRDYSLPTFQKFLETFDTLQGMANRAAEMQEMNQDALILQQCVAELTVDYGGFAAIAEQLASMTPEELARAAGVEAISADVSQAT